MSLFDLLFSKKQSSASVARERLQLIIAHERTGESPTLNFLPALQQELIQVISKYVRINPEDIKLSLEKQGNYEVLEVNIVMPDIR